MKVLIELYDKDTLKNIVAPLTLRPDRVVYLYDKGMDDMDAFRSLVTCFQKNMPNIVVEDIPVDISSVKTLCAAVCRVAERYEAANCTLELTGGSDDDGRRSGRAWNGNSHGTYGLGEGLHYGY